MQDQSEGPEVEQMWLPLRWKLSLRDGIYRVVTANGYEFEGISCVTLGGAAALAWEAFGIPRDVFARMLRTTEEVEGLEIINEAQVHTIDGLRTGEFGEAFEHAANRATCRLLGINLVQGMVEQAIETGEKSTPDTALENSEAHFQEMLRT